MSPGRLAARRGFTLVEVLLGTVLMVGVSYGIFHLFRATNRQASQAAFLSAAQKEARSGLKRIHDELSKAAYWTELTPGRVYYLKPDGARSTSDSEDLATQRQKEEDARKLFFLTHDGAPDLTASYDVARPPVTTPIVLLSWYQCVPRRTGLGGSASPDDPDEGYLAQCFVLLVGDKIIFQRETRSGDDQFTRPITVALMNNVEKASITLETKADPAEVMAGSQVTVAVTLHHPNWGVFPNTRLSQEITARCPVGIDGT